MFFMARKTVLPAHQRRSRESLRKLLNATTEVLGQHGVEGATIPRIARHAGLTPGSVYRRFHDKEALMETAILGILERQDERMKTDMTPTVTAQMPLALFAEQVIAGMVATYRTNAALLRAIKQFVQGRTRTPLSKRASQLQITYFQRVVELFLLHREEIRHPDPHAAVSLALMMLVGTLYELVVWPRDPRHWKALLPRDDQALKQELTRAFLSYLGVEVNPVGRTATMDLSRATQSSI
jgi:AcrR family transcriptional regulator